MHLIATASGCWTHCARRWQRLWSANGGWGSMRWYGGMVSRSLLEKRRLAERLTAQDYPRLRLGSTHEVTWPDGAFAPSARFSEGLRTCGADQPRNKRSGRGACPVPPGGVAGALARKHWLGQYAVVWCDDRLVCIGPDAPANCDQKCSQLNRSCVDVAESGQQINHQSRGKA